MIPCKLCWLNRVRDIKRKCLHRISFGILVIVMKIPCALKLMDGPGVLVC